MNMPYQQPMMNYTPNYGTYQYNPMASYQRYQQQLKHLTMCLWQQMYGFLADAVRQFLSRIHLHRLSVLQMLTSQ